MEEELNYVNVTFKTNGVPAHDKLINLEIIYDEVKTEEKTLDTQPIIRDPKKKVQTNLVLVSLGILCLILMVVIVTLSICFTTELRRQNFTLTMENLKLQAEKRALTRRTEELFRDRDRLSWTVGVILEYDSFPVKKLCPQKECKPCLDNWVPFQSKCYLFTKQEYYSGWKTWQKGREFCEELNGDLVSIESQEEQDFINNHTKEYSDKNHGYWIGLSNKNTKEEWAWADGSNVTVMFWMAEQPGYRVSCALSNPHAEASANWGKVSCDMRNRWICETRALVRED